MYMFVKATHKGKEISFKVDLSKERVDRIEHLLNTFDSYEIMSYHNKPEESAEHKMWRLCR